MDPLFWIALACFLCFPALTAAGGRRPKRVVFVAHRVLVTGGRTGVTVGARNALGAWTARILSPFDGTTQLTVLPQVG
jgi:hypothetical protein